MTDCVEIDLLDWNF